MPTRHLRNAYACDGSLQSFWSFLPCGPLAIPAGSIRISESFITTSLLRAWDRAVDKDGKVVWGSAAGPLEMMRYSQVPR